MDGRSLGPKEEGDGWEEVWVLKSKEMEVVWILKRKEMDGMRYGP
jgi:hypothetical protein